MSCTREEAINVLIHELKNAHEDEEFVLLCAMPNGVRAFPTKGGDFTWDTVTNFYNIAKD